VTDPRGDVGGLDGLIPRLDARAIERVDASDYLKELAVVPQADRHELQHARRYFFYLARVAQQPAVQHPGLLKAAWDRHIFPGRTVVEMKKHLAEMMKHTTGAAGDGEAAPTISESDLAALRAQAAPVLDADDPLSLVGQELRRLGYGGDLKPPTNIYVCWATRLLPKGRGTLLGHIQTNGESGSGKTYGNDLVQVLHPPECYEKKTATSTRDLVHDETSLRHRVLYYGQANSIPGADGTKPTEENSPVIGFFLTLLQDGEASYSYPIRDKDTGRFTSETKTRQGPTVLVTTTVEKIAQTEMDTRLSGLNWPDDRAQQQAALKAQADLHMGALIPEPRPEFLAFQKYLQALAPISVVFPYVHALNDLLDRLRVTIDPRVLRDSARMRSMICAVAILRHAKRQRDEHGRIIATLDDYATVADLVSDMYKNTSGVAPRLREIVNAVRTMPNVNGTGLARHFRVSRQAISRHVRRALKEGWLVNTEIRPGYPATLTVRNAEALPTESGMPSAEQLERWSPGRP